MSRWNTFSYALVGVHLFSLWLGWKALFVLFSSFPFFLFSGRSFENFLFLVWYGFLIRYAVVHLKTEKQPILKKFGC